jgi:hypothetical protein
VNARVGRHVDTHHSRVGLRCPSSGGPQRWLAKVTIATFAVPSLSAIDVYAERENTMKSASLRTCTFAAVAGLAMWTTGCSGRPATPAVATLTAGASTGASSANAGAAATPNALEYAQCMRAHGVPDFPDPVNGGFEINNTTPGSDLDPTSPKFIAADSACQALSPEGHAAGGTADPQLQAKALAYAACIRSHGVPSYPDPVFVGGSIRETVRAGSGPDPDSPQFIAAQSACQSLEPFARGGQPPAGGGVASSGSSGP